MIWIMLATLAVVFVVGFRVLTSGARKAIRRLSDRMNAPCSGTRWSRSDIDPEL
ncbi:DUF1198 domain-containing protein, partial [Escherichia coli]|nr:DUF1198 domain-containing protein [Escherichia coli]